MQTRRLRIWLAALLVGGSAARMLSGDAQPAETPASAQAQPSASLRTPASVANTVDDLILLEKSSRTPPPIAAGPDEATITQLASTLLARKHYLRRAVDDTTSSRLLDEYLDALDNLRLHFFQSDVQEFERYRTELDDQIRRGDISAARLIFTRFLERVDQRVAVVAELLKNGTFDFSADDRYTPDRRKADRPKDLEEAQALWKQHLRYEYLQEKLGLDRKKKARMPEPTTATNAPPKVEPTAAAASPDAEVVKTLTRRYSRMLKTLRDFDGADVFQLYLTTLTHVYDPHSDYLGRQSLENFAMNMNLALFGIGAVLQSEDGYCKIRELKPGPAMRSKRLKPGDRIIAVAQAGGEPVDVVDMKLTKVVELIRGPKGSQVTLTVIPVDASDPSERITVTLERDEIKLEDEEAKARLVDLPLPEGRSVRLGVIDLPSFYGSVDLGTGSGRSRPRSTTIDVAQLLVKLKKENVEGIILDLRRNGGGSLEEAIQLTGLFIKEGPVVQVRDADGEVAVDRDDDPAVLWDGPLIVLTSRFSASASEILAGALQDYGRALIVGDSSTHGKGTVQSLIQLQPILSRIDPWATNNPGAVKLTIRKFYRVTGSSTQLKGVVPDIVLGSVNNLAEVGEGSLDDALPWDAITSTDFDGLNRIQPVLAELRRRSQQRLATDPDYAYTLEDVELYRKYLAEKSVSLNEKVRRQETRENEERLEQRKHERKARPPANETIYEITLKQANLPGLPTPGVAAEEKPPIATDATDPDEETPDEKEKGAPADMALKEAKRLLIDLIELTPKNPSVAARH